MNSSLYLAIDEIPSRILCTICEMARESFSHKPEPYVRQTPTIASLALTLEPGLYVRSFIESALLLSRYSEAAFKAIAGYVNGEHLALPSMPARKNPLQMTMVLEEIHEAAQRARDGVRNVTESAAKSLSEEHGVEIKTKYIDVEIQVCIAFILCRCADRRHPDLVYRCFWSPKDGRGRLRRSIFYRKDRS